MMKTERFVQTLNAVTVTEDWILCSFRYILGRNDK